MSNLDISRQNSASSPGNKANMQSLASLEGLDQL
jgi:hypothetical protein